MSIPESLLQRLPEKLRNNGILFTGSEERRSFLRREDGEWGSPGLEKGRLTSGCVTELASLGGDWATALALRAVRELQEEAVRRGVELPRIAFVDPSGSLFAPGLERRGVQLSRFLVVEPREESLENVTLRLVESRLFALVIVDLLGVVGRTRKEELGGWGRALRRCQLALQSSERSVLLLTNVNAPRALPLPVRERWECRRHEGRRLVLRDGKTGTATDWGCSAFGFVSEGPTEKGREGVRYGVAV